MTEEPNKVEVKITPQEQQPALPPVSAETKALVEQEMPNASVDVQNETMKLVEAMRSRALSDFHSAGEYTRERYLSFVQEARETLEKEKLFDPERVEYSMKLLQYDVEKNWDSLVKQVQDFGDRLSDAANAAWNALTAPRPSDR